MSARISRVRPFVRLTLHSLSIGRFYRHIRFLSVLILYCISSPPNTKRDVRHWRTTRQTTNTTIRPKPFAWRSDTVIGRNTKLAAFIAIMPALSKIFTSSLRHIARTMKRYVRIRFKAIFLPCIFKPIIT